MFLIHIDRKEKQNLHVIHRGMVKSITVPTINHEHEG